MTAPDPRLGEIQALVEGLADLCPEYMRQSIRHLQRNCDIDCNTHEDEPTWDDCKQPGRYDGERMALALASIPYLLAELRKAQDALGRVEGLADAWEARGEHDMKFSKAFGDEDIAMALLSGGAAMVENARHIRNAIRAAVAAATGGEDAQD